MSKNRKLIFMLFTWACFIAIGVCIIVNVAIDKQITWSAYPILSIIFGWLIVSPLVIKKYGLAISLCALMLFVFPFLYFLEKITPNHSWFAPLGVPSAIVGIIAGWLIYLLFRFLKISLWYRSAIAVFLVGVIANMIIGHYVDAFLSTESSFLNRFINIFSCVAVSALLVILGYRNKKVNPANDDV